MLSLRPSWLHVLRGDSQVGVYQTKKAVGIDFCVPMEDGLALGRCFVACRC